MEREAIAVVAVDLDGTLLRSDGTVSARTIAALRRCRDSGIKTVIATGRRRRSAAAVLPKEVESEAWVCHSGAEVYTDDRCIFREPLSPELARQIARWIEANHPDCTLSVEVDGELLANRALGGPLDYRLARLSEAISEPPANVVVESARANDLCSIDANLPPGCKMLVTDDGRFGLIMASTVSKAAALRHLVDEWGLSLAQVIAFGNDTNDIEFIAECGIGVAMGNAIPEAKRVADLVTLSNDEDGIAEVLEALLEDRARWAPRCAGAMPGKGGRT